MDQRKLDVEHFDGRPASPVTLPLCPWALSRCARSGSREPFAACSTGSESGNIGSDPSLHAGLRREAWPFDQPFHWILNLAVGGAWGRAGGPIDDSVFPQQLEVDWVRVYERDGK